MTQAIAGIGRPSSFADQVYGQILSAIVSGEYPTGTRLPSEEKLGQRFGVSRPTVREALARLQRDGLVDIRKGSGSHVLSAPPPDLTALADAGSIAGVQRFQEFRQTVEAAAAFLAATRRTDAELAAIEAAHRQFATEIRAGHFNRAADLAFHMAILAASGNEFYAQALENARPGLAEFMGLSLSLSQSRSALRAEMVVAEHAAIVDAIRARDPQAARVTMEHHLLQSRRRMVDGSLAP